MDPQWENIMPVTLSIKNVPDDLADRLRAQAEKNHRSLQGELMAILHEKLEEENVLPPDRFLAEVRRLNLQTPAEATDWIRKDRDAR